MHGVPHSEVAESLFRKDPTWHAPSVWVSEFRNVVLRYWRKSIADLEACLESLALARRIVPPSRTHAPADRIVIELAGESGCSAYDSEFAAVASSLKADMELYSVPLLSGPAEGARRGRGLTWDKRLLEGFPSIAAKPETFIAK